MRDELIGDRLWAVDDFCCGAVRSEHPLCPVLGLCPESSVSVVADCTCPYPARVFGRAFDDFFPEAFFFVVVHIPALPECRLGSYPGVNFFMGWFRSRVAIEGMLGIAGLAIAGRPLVVAVVRLERLVAARSGFVVLRQLALGLWQRCG